LEPETRYARSGDVSIAYQVTAERPSTSSTPAVHLSCRARVAGAQASRLRSTPPPSSRGWSASKSEQILTSPGHHQDALRRLERPPKPHG